MKKFVFEAEPKEKSQKLDHGEEINEDEIVKIDEIVSRKRLRYSLGMKSLTNVRVDFFRFEALSKENKGITVELFKLFSIE